MSKVNHKTKNKLNLKSFGLLNKKEMQKQGLWFTQKEVAYLVREAKKICFTPMPQYTKKKVFNKKEVLGHIYFLHTKSESTFLLDKFEIKNAGLDIFKDNVSNIFFTLLFKQHEERMSIYHEE